MTWAPIDPVRNLQLVAERLGWPDGALEACNALKAEFPRWTVFWTSGGLPVSPEPGFRAAAQVRHVRIELFCESAEQLKDKLQDENADLPPLDSWAEQRWLRQH